MYVSDVCVHWQKDAHVDWSSRWDQFSAVQLGLLSDSDRINGQDRQTLGHCQWSVLFSLSISFKFQSFSFYAFTNNSRQWALCSWVVHLSVCLSVVCQSVNACFTWRAFSSVTGLISMKLGTNVHHLSGHCWKDFQGHGVKRSRSCSDNRRHFMNSLHGELLMGFEPKLTQILTTL